MYPRSKKRFTLKIIFSYAVLGVLALLAAYFIYDEFKSYASTQSKGDDNLKLLRTNELLTNLYEAENLSKLALQSKQPKDLKAYAQKVDSITILIDSLKPLAQANLGNQVSKLDSVQHLLQQKVFNSAELRRLKVKNENNASFDSVLQAFHKMEVEMGRITPETFAPNFEQLSPDTQESIREYVAILNKNIPNSDGASNANNIDSILEVSKSILNKAKTQTAAMERSMLQKELQIYRTDLELSQKMRSVLSDFEREMVQNAFLDNITQKQALQRSTRLAGGAVILGLIIVIVFTFLISKDYWKGQRYQEQLEKEKKYSESLLKSREQLISTVSHDLRTPLNTINGYSELMEHSGLNNKQLNYLKNVKSASGYVNNLVNDLLDFSKLEAGKVQLEKVPFVLASLIHETASHFDEINDKKGLELKLEIPEELNKPIISDPFRIRQILTNLIGNAYKFTEEGFIKVVAAVQEKKDGPWVHIKVIDTGIGIEPEKQELIFQEFTQAGDYPEHKQGGYGLGLTISKKLTELLGGTLSLSSEVHKGSTFTLELPIQFSRHSFFDKGPNKEHTRDLPTSVLVIDDDENMLELIAEIGRINHIRVKTVSNFKQLEHSEIFGFDKVLTDIQMPKMDGFDVLGTLKAMGFENPVIAMTGQSISKKSTFISAGFTDVIQKPFSAHILLSTLGKANNHFEEAFPQVPKTDTALFSISQIAEFLDGPKAIQEVLQVFLENNRLNLDLLLTSIGNSDYKELRSVAHKMLPMFRQLEVKDSISILEQLENLDEHEKGEQVYQLLTKLKQLLFDLETEIQDYLIKLPVGTG
ncbi:ATP-binding protein [Flagellimonas aequoris]|uniref:histidine kinase n=1 Tax=Flagellimonas aequoris TaxID=2306997 RepID=A0A418N797_9FLAO|nr:ATP-binding protein [Allomuricauda aequoris]RIV70705.1 response regulator [Allomuricauda aequoris]TXK02143.1 response regulator [Allomuricauda aequoris]